MPDVLFTKFKYSKFTQIMQGLFLTGLHQLLDKPNGVFERHIKITIKPKYSPISHKELWTEGSFH